MQNGVERVGVRRIRPRRISSVTTDDGWVGGQAVVDQKKPKYSLSLPGLWDNQLTEKSNTGKEDAVILKIQTACGKQE